MIPRWHATLLGQVGGRYPTGAAVSGRGSRLHEMMSARGIRSLHALYANAPVAYRRIGPGEVGVHRIGHFGFFRAQFEQTLWPLVPQWLLGC